MATAAVPLPDPRRVDVRLVPAALISWAVTAAGILWPVGPAATALCLAVGVVSGCTRWRMPAHRTAACAVTAGVIVASAVGAGFGLAITLRANEVRDNPVTQRFGTVDEVIVTPTESPRSIGTGRLMFRADIAGVGAQPSRGRVVVFTPVLGFAEASAGQPLRFRARISRPTRRDLSVAMLTAAGEPVMGQASAMQRLAGSVRRRFAETATQVLPAGQAALLPALVLGDTSAVPRATSAEFRAAGLTHLTAVSGANVTIVCGALLLASYLVGPRVAVGFAAVALVGFVIVVQPTASVLRAAVMGAVALLAVLSARRRQAIPALSTTVLALMIVAPQLAVDVGFALSVSATAALVVIAPVWARRLATRGWPKPLADAVAVAAAAQLVTAPLVAGISGTFSLVAIAANLLVAVVIAPITVLGTGAAALGPLWPAAASLLIRFTGPELWWLGEVAHWAAAVPTATVAVPSGAVGVLAVASVGIAVVLLWRWHWFRLGCGCAAVCLFAWSVSGWVGGQGTTVSAARDTIVT